jgi:hypothetical protein
MATSSLTPRTFGPLFAAPLAFEVGFAAPSVFADLLPPRVAMPASEDERFLPIPNTDVNIFGKLNDIKMKLLTNHNRQGEGNEQYVWC